MDNNDSSNVMLRVYSGTAYVLGDLKGERVLHIQLIQQDVC
jgi:hypothetical protein